MQKTIYFNMLMRPDVAFALIWVLVLGLYSPAMVNFYPDPQPTVYLMVFGTLAIALVGSFLLPRPQDASRTPISTLPSVIFDSRFILAMCATWMVGFALIIIYSGGLPYFWAIKGTDRYYFDYGVPTFSGAWNTFRIVIAILATVALVRSDNWRWVPALVLAFLTLTVVGEVNRGGYVLYCMNVVAAGVLAAPSFKRQLAWVILLLAVTLGGIYGIGGIRTADAKAVVAITSPFEQPTTRTPEEEEQLLEEAAPWVFAMHDAIIENPALSWVYLYLTTPVANLHKAAAGTLATPPFPGFYSLYPFLPTIVRPEIAVEDRYPLPLASKAYTMSSAYSTLIADFGFIGASIAMGLQLLLGIWVFNLARRHLWALLMAPMFFAISMLSFFTDYFLTLLTPFHLLLALVLGQVVPRIWARRPGGAL
ncbi:hypothetical protein GGR20_000916 [Devosia subaequoris]|uniref:Oligosaccharide repeat unit polymerase n=1 Tax=Devosia subaequoris TaxID=395930 RepID=A0A7W6NAV9_9HYPH|nr:oligosaccharide repeat unit polymerase [Devosia subaequoris]MBB4051298.1 hypothetical protein [Devosia subaequoris]MCP1211405.1 hypothetical protein [Devosia subaequoris]